VTVNRYATQAGKKYEADLMKYLREQGCDVERLRLTGVEDEGDLLLRGGRVRFVIEAKREKGFNLAGWVKEAQTERENYDKHRGYSLFSSEFVVVHHARGKNIGQSYVTTTLDEWLKGT
jgi:hypothetical protein